MIKNVAVQNNKMKVVFDLNKGGVKSLTLLDDENMLNWIEGKLAFGTLFGMSSFHGTTVEKNGVVNKYDYKGLVVTVSRKLTDNGYEELYEFANTGNAPLGFDNGELGINTPFNDSYDMAEVCLKQRCHAHIWCGGSSSYIYGLRMNASGNNLGMVVTHGRIDSYGVTRKWNSNDRGDFSLFLPKCVLAPNAKAQIGFSFFAFDKEDDFFDKASEYSNFLSINADKYTYALGETAHFGLSGTDTGTLKINLGEEEIHAEKVEGGYKFEYTFTALGEHKFVIKYNNHETYIYCNAISGAQNIIDNRLDFLINKQQCLDSSSKFYGGFKLYDNETEQPFVEDKPLNDRNIGRERVGIICALIARLKNPIGLNEEEISTWNERLMTAVAFVDSSIVKEDGTVCDTAVFKNSIFHHRLYNYSMYMTMFASLFELTGRKYYFDRAMAIARQYYKRGGHKFYAICMPIATMANIARKNNFPELDELISLFRLHGDTMIIKGSNYPAHEVKFEQSIVAPAVDTLIECYMATEDKKYLDEALAQLPLLLSFCGKQPSYHMNEIAIRHWDGFWFGKNKMYGDTFPHYWSCINAAVYSKLARILGDASYQEKADKVLENNLCLFEEDGRGHCAYVMPSWINGRKGGFYDPWANDQDWALYYNIQYNSKLQKSDTK